MVGCFLTPSLESKYTYPAALKDEIADVVGEYLFDTKDFRTDDKEYLLRQVYEMTDRRFALAEHLLETKPWSLFAMVEMGPDRMHHGFWKYMDPEHRKHEPGNPYESAILDYHRHVDGLIGKLLEHADEDTVVFVLSDHGAKRLDGGIRINEWLRREGLLATLAEPNGVVVAARRRRRLVADDGVGGGRLLRARLPQRRRPRARGDDRARGLRGRPRRPRAPDRGDPGRRGQSDPDAVYKPEELYGDPQGVAPDLIVVFGDLLWRSVGTIGGDEGIQTLENDTGPDDANHAQDGLYVVAGPGIEASGRHDAHLLDIAPTVLELLGIEEPAGLRGRSLAPALGARADAGAVHLAERRVEEPVARRRPRGARPSRGTSRATPIAATTTPPSRIPSGIAAQAPARTAPKTRPRSSAGTISVIDREEERVDRPGGEARRPPAPRARPGATAGPRGRGSRSGRREAEEERPPPRQPVPDRAVAERARERGAAETPNMRPRSAALPYSSRRRRPARPGNGASMRFVSRTMSDERRARAAAAR